MTQPIRLFYTSLWEYKIIKNDFIYGFKVIIYDTHIMCKITIDYNFKVKLLINLKIIKKQGNNKVFFVSLFSVNYEYGIGVKMLRIYFLSPNIIINF
jgi:hypothetical protein